MISSVRVAAPIIESTLFDVLPSGPYSHNALHGSFEDLFSREIRRKIVKKEKYCSFLTCKCCKTKNERNTEEDRPKDPDKAKPCCNKICLCKHSMPDDHVHGNCSHQKVFHVDHWDYLVNGELHHQVDGKCFIHGQLKVHKPEEEDVSVFDLQVI